MIIVAGRPVFLPEDSVTGRELKQRAGIEPGRKLIMHNPEGESVMIRDIDVVQVRDDVLFEDIPDFTKG
ncbi:multiubiquitin domain-containing protein [Candidatus Calescamantes bacterium]|nr:multiubiquitin domain-containing protein [Candidatus Calescamantes bacterium]